MPRDVKQVATQVARAVLLRVCPVCGNPVTGRSVKVTLGPVYAELHRDCADPSRRLAHAAGWLAQFLKT